MHWNSGHTMKNNMIVSFITKNEKRKTKNYELNLLSIDYHWQIQRKLDRTSPILINIWLMTAPSVFSSFFSLIENKRLFYKDTVAPCRLESKMAEFKTVLWLRPPFTTVPSQPTSAVWTWWLGRVSQEPGVQRQVTTKNGCRSILEIPPLSLK